MVNWVESGFGGMFMDWGFVEVARSAETVVRVCLGIRSGEEVALAADYGSDSAVVYALLAAVRAAGATPTLVIMPRQEYPGSNMSAVAAQALAGASAVIAPTSTSVAFTPELRKGIDERRLRAILMTGVTRAELSGGAALADFEEVLAVTKRLAEALTEGNEIWVTSDRGSDLRASLRGRACEVGASFAREPGQISAFPSGEAWMCPVEGTAEGVLVADGSGHLLGKLEEPIRVEFRQGRAISINGGRQATFLRDLIQPIKDADNLGELSVGTNPAARFTGNITEDKKQAGTVHFALGTSVKGGRIRSDVHIDLLITTPTVHVDGRVIVANRQILV